MTSKDTVHHFLSGGGEMGELVRAKDWSKTPLGNTTDWPQSLRTMVSVMLNNPFGMHIIWGNDYTQIYNDGYRPILGENKHPHALGTSIRESFEEVWPLLQPLFDIVMEGGEAIRQSDFMVPLNRNGFTEICYFDFSYSPIRKEDGKVGGVLTTVIETTKKKAIEDELKNSQEKFAMMVENTDLLIATSDETSNATYFNKAWTNLTGRSMEQLLKFGWLDMLHDDGKQEFLDTYIDAFNNKKPYSSELHLLNKEGIYIWLFVQGQVSYRANGSFAGYTASCIDITERKQIEKEKQKFNTLAEASSEFIGIANIDYAIQYLNPAAQEMLGWNDIEGKNIIDCVYYEDKEIANKILPELIENGKFQHEIRFWNERTKAPFWLQWNGITLKDPSSKEIVGLATVSPNITKRKQAEEILKESEARFRMLAESLPQLIFEADDKGKPLYASGKWEDYTGLDPKNEGNWKLTVHPNDFENNIIAWGKSLVTGNPFQQDIRLKSKQGIYNWYRAFAEPIFDNHQVIIKWVGALTNIHDEKSFTQELEKQVLERTKELKLLNDTLIKSEQRYHLMVEEVQDYAILYLSLNGTIENWNKGAEKMKGYQADEIVGKNFSIFYTDQDRQENLPEILLSKATLTGKAVQEGWRIRKDKTLFWANVAITAVRNEAKEVIGFSKVTHDLTSKKEIDDKLKIIATQLEQKNEKLQKMNKELESFAYVSSHDLQEPLRKIQMFCSRIAEKEYQNLSQAGKDIFTRMQGSASRMQALIEDLLTYSRATTTENKFDKVDLKKIVTDVVENIKEELEQKNGTIIIGDMCEAPVITFQFRQLILNLFSNSLKFSIPEIPPIINITSKIKSGAQLNNDQLIANKNYCHISISDNGIGFEPKYAEKIFELFQRLHGNSTYKGTGIGLAIVKKIVENHNGIITAKGNMNEGATFDIYWPMS